MRYSHLSDKNNGNITLAYAYVSVPVASIIKEDNARIVLKWLNYKITGNAVILSETDEVMRELLYSKEDYQQVPATALVSRSPLDIE